MQLYLHIRVSTPLSELHLLICVGLEHNLTCKNMFPRRACVGSKFVVAHISLSVRLSVRLSVHLSVCLSVSIYL
jgi:hypothetical protein